MFDDKSIGGRMLDAFDHADDTFTYYFPVAYSIILVAAGKFDAVVTSARLPWGLTAASLIATEARILISDIFGNPITDWNTDIRGLRAIRPVSRIAKRINAIIKPVLNNTPINLQ